MTEQEKIEQLLKAYYAQQDQYRGYVFAATRNYHATEEILQSIAIVVAQKAAAFDFDRELKPWLMGIARNKIKKWHSDNGKLAKNVQYDALEQCLAHHAKPFSQEEVSVRQEALVHCLRQLPDRQKKILELRYISRKDCAEVAEQLGRSVQSIYSILKRVKLELKRCIESKTTQLEAL